MQAFKIVFFSLYTLKIATSVNFFSISLIYKAKMTIFCYKKEFIVLFKMQDKTLF
ncbi:conserved hypothetical protein [Listeria innocua FSL S4-378]|uniref:Uncharacterized protein n=1 Tax=Listeria innocua ATCC 33091 TaxID=1002366 RepID=A0AB72Z8D5_LISIO|nr:conserved hypothetical protein [Listeria innocua FSL S4-378]EHN61104.1 hypothetical protein HMPREF0557_01844 [Listeria innocua ATCC 33091]